MKPEKPENPCLFPDTFYTGAPLNTWAQWAAAIQRAPLDAQNCLIDWAQSSIMHEFLLVCARHHSGAQIVLGIDRNAERRPVAPEGATSTASSMSSLGPGTSSSFSSIFSHEAYDRVQVSHDGTPAPILAQHGLRSTRTSATPDNKNDNDRPRRPSLLHLSVLLLTIHAHFPSYALLQYQCYFFARATCLALLDLFGGAETELEEGPRAATWRGVHVSLYSAGRAAFQNMLLLPLAEFPVLVVPAGLFAVYSAVKLYDGNVVEGEGDRRRISDKKIREHAIPLKYRAAWRSFVLERQKVIK
ncbi:hypothetical protein BC826DRAFT_1173848 [Russula brevipes]|nr:hypothetical protein BC826DRAFT_1173848 [Russula brevipes]